MAINIGRLYRARKKEGVVMGSIGVTLSVLFSTYAHINALHTKQAKNTFSFGNTTDDGTMCYGEPLPTRHRNANLIDIYHPQLSFLIPQQSFDIPEDGEIYPLDTIARNTLESQYALLGLKPRYQTALRSSSNTVSIDYKDPRALAAAKIRFDEYIKENETIHGVKIPFEALEGTFIAQELTQINGYASLIIAVPESQHQGTLDLKATNKGTNARGIYQFIPSTGLQRIAQTKGTNLAPLFPEAESIRSARIKNREGTIIDTYYVPKDPNKGYSYGNRDFSKEKTILDAVYYDTIRASIMMAQNLKANIDYYKTQIPSSHTLTINDAHSTHFRGAGSAIKFYWRMKNEPNAPAYSLYEQRNEDGAITETGINSLEVQKNLPVYNTRVKRINGNFVAVGKWRSHKEVHDFYITKGMTLDPLTIYSSQHSMDIEIQANDGNTANKTTSNNDTKRNTYALRLTAPSV